MLIGCVCKTEIVPTPSLYFGVNCFLNCTKQKLVELSTLERGILLNILTFFLSNTLLRGICYVK